MGLLDGLLENVLGIGAQQSQGPMLQVALQVLEQNGGLPGIISKFEHGGMADHVSSWVATGANMPISGAQLQEILGMGQSTISTHLAQLKHAGMVEDRRAGKNIWYRSKSGEVLSLDIRLRTSEDISGIVPSM